MPTLTRLIFALIVLAGLAYVGVLALVTFEKPTPREIVVPIPLPSPSK